MRTLAIGLLFGLTLAGCDHKASPPTPTGSGAPASSASAAVETYGVPIGLPGTTMHGKVVDTVNPKHQKPFAGPTGTLTGRVRIEGDPPPDTNLKFPSKCNEAAATYAKVFRVGLDGALGDAMVAVTGYQGYVPPDGPSQRVTIHGCAVTKRTIVMTYGQRLDVANVDHVDPYVPYLDGAPARAGMVAVPGGDTVKLYPIQPGHYMLRDQMPSGLVADVFVLKYATHDVTGLDGQYQIKGIPVGKVHVDVFLPVIGKTQGREIEIKPGDNKADFTLEFDSTKDLPGEAPAASSSASAKPAAPKDDRKIPR